MNGGMKVNKVAFCMEDGRVGLLLCGPVGTHWNALSVSASDIRARGPHSVALGNLTPPGGVPPATFTPSASERRPPKKTAT